MKKRLYILVIIVLSMGFVGCHKIDLNPHACDEGDRDVENFEKGNDSDEDDFGRDEDDIDVITDANHDEDEDKQKKR